MSKSVFDGHEVEIRQAFEQGATSKEVAARFGRKERSLQEWCVKNGILSPFAKAQRARDPLHQQSLAAQGIVTKPDDHVSREEGLRQQISELNGALRKVRNEDVKFERIVDTLETLIPSLEPRYTPRVNPAIKSGNRKPHTLLLMWSDQHAGEMVSLEETGGLNEYDWSIMMHRHDLLREKLISWAEIFGPVEELVIAAIGDGVSGDIHDELKQTNEMPLAEAIVQWGLDGGAWIESLVPYFKKIRVICVRGNHSRFSQKPQAKKGYASGDWQASQIQAQVLRQYDSVEFIIPRANRAKLEIYGRKLMLIHGDAVPSSTMVGVPWGGVIRYSEKLARSHDFDHLLLGHFHEPHAIGKRIFVNGSTKGVDEYILDRHGTGSPPAQVLLPFHPDHGVCGAQYIDLVD